MTDPLGKMLLDDQTLVIVSALLHDAERNALLAHKGEPFYREMNRALLRSTVKRVAELLGMQVSSVPSSSERVVQMRSVIPGPCEGIVPESERGGASHPVSLPCDSEPPEAA